MRKMSQAPMSLLMLLVLVFGGASAAFGQGASSPAATPAASGSTVPITTVVTVLGPKYSAPPALAKSDIIVYQDKKKVEISSWIPAQGDKANLQLAILIDDASTTDFAIQLNDLRAFINAQPATTAVGVFYASNGTVQPVSQFSTDHAAVAKTVRIPLGYWGAYSSIYFSIQDLIKRWPVTPGSRREILLFADGIDRLHGDYPTSPDVDPTVAKAQTAGVIIHSIYVTGVGHISRSFFRVSLGQSNLSQLTDGTGGYAFFQGFQTPVAIAPFLDQFNMVLKNQYWLTFDANRSTKPKGSLQRFRVTSEIKDLDIAAPTSIFVPIL